MKGFKIFLVAALVLAVGSAFSNRMTETGFYKPTGGSCQVGNLDQQGKGCAVQPASFICTITDASGTYPAYSGSGDCNIAADELKRLSN